MNIEEFQKGQAIVRIKAAKSLGPMMTFSGETIDRGGDRSYMGDKLIFIGIANGEIYLQRTKEIDIKIFGEDLLELEIDLWSDDWELYIDPLTLLDGVEIPYSKTTIENIEKKIEQAIEDENYELAEKLKKQYNIK